MDMAKSKGKLITAIVGTTTAAVAGLAIYEATKPCPAGEVKYKGSCVPADVSMSAEYTTIEVGEEDTFTVTVKDSKTGQALEGVMVTLVITGPKSANAKQETNANGQAVFDVTFSTAGEYQVVAQI